MANQVVRRLLKNCPHPCDTCALRWYCSGGMMCEDCFKHIQDPSFPPWDMNRTPTRAIYNKVFPDFVPYDKEIHGE